MSSYSKVPVFPAWLERASLLDPTSPGLWFWTKYGKLILDRGIRRETPLDEAVKVALLSFDSAMRSNLESPGPWTSSSCPPIRRPAVRRRIEADDVDFNDLSLRWAALLHEATEAIPNPPWMATEEP